MVGERIGNTTSLKKQFFILGRERSGTTLLRSILHQHPGIHIPPECTFIWDLWPVYKDFKKWTSHSAAQFINDLKLDPRFKFWHTDEELLLKKLSNLPETSTYANACQAVLQSYSSSNSGFVSQDDSSSWLGDKNPVYVEHVAFLMKLFPKAHFVVIVRDYKDALASIWSTGFEARWTASICHKWVKCYEDLKDWQEKFPHQFDIIRYEDLVTSPVTTLKPVMKNLDIEWTDELLEFDKTNEVTLEGVKGKALEFVHNINKPLNPKSIGRWKDDLTPRMVKVADDICAETATKFGYISSNSTNSSSKNYLLAKLWSRLYFNIEKTSQSFPSSLKRLYLKLKWRFNGGWTKAVKSTAVNDKSTV